ncbi:hypothetical protein BCR44DRAFT_1433958 [Catenaria anguillulae PL171]|uniref:Uncharacterized protein n=1 Tax=Catenaria anguillulae PL171 TaxID=765915 RepID=A0A1Y2HPE2_9FUNG|nr:hypothetical protein BCR44DRAFT_1433958 [Catenaria anguillulae PL171]
MNPVALIVLLVALVATTVMAASAPFPLPATYKVDKTANLNLTFKRDGTYTYTTALRCATIKCLGSGKWEYNAEAREMTFKQEDMQGNNIYQTWRLGGMSRDGRVSLIFGNKMVDAMGMFGTQYPAPE